MLVLIWPLSSNSRYKSKTGYWTRAIKKFALFDFLKKLYSDTKILSKYIPSLQKRLQTMDFHSESIVRCNTICRRNWYIAAHIWKIYDLKIEVVPFIIYVSTDLTKCIKISGQKQKCQKIFFFINVWRKNVLTFTSLSLVLLWQLFYLFCYKILVSEYKLFKKSNKANFFIALVQ
jgi:hypothetical protein